MEFSQVDSNKKKRIKMEAKRFEALSYNQQSLKKKWLESN